MANPQNLSSKNGRKRGVANKTTSAVRNAIVNAFETVGGEQYLVMVALTDPKTFVSLLGRVLPLKAEVTGEDGGPVITEIRRTIIRPPVTIDHE